MASPGPPPPPPAQPVGPGARFAPNQPLYAGAAPHPPPPGIPGQQPGYPGQLAVPPQGAAGAPGPQLLPPQHQHQQGGLAPPPSVGYVAPSPTGLAPSRPYTASPYSAGPGSGPPPSAGPPGGGNPAQSAMPPVYPANPAQARYRPGKRLIICCDGTWLDADSGLMNDKIERPSNVTRIGRAIKPQSADGIAQVVYYQAGIGSTGGPVTKVVGGATAEGISTNIREGYSFICLNWAPGDEIYLIGFSRGAFTARSIGGVISVVGLLTKSGLHDLPVIFKDVENRHNEDYRSPLPNVPFPDKPSASDPAYAAELQRRGLSRTNIPIKAIGVWETVGSLGIPRVTWLERLGLQKSQVKEYTFFDTSLSDNIENAFQALALDEQRAAFRPTIWERPRNKTNRTNLRQVWFPGVHSNVGGGYPDMDIANITLAWMIAQLEHMIDFNQEYLREQYQAEQEYYDESDQEPRPWSFGEIYNSASGLYALGGKVTRTPGQYTRVDPYTGKPTSHRLRETNEYVHPSVRSRIGLGGPSVQDRGVYEPAAILDAYKLRLTGAALGSPEPVAVWESLTSSKSSRRESSSDEKRKSGSGRDSKRQILAESPLFETEMRLLRGSPWVENYLFGNGSTKPPKRQSARMSNGQQSGGGGVNGSGGGSKPGRGESGGGGGGGGGGSGSGRRNRDERREERRQERRRSMRPSGGGGGGGGGNSKRVDDDDDDDDESP